MEQNFTINVTGEREPGDDYSRIHIIITAFQNITPELIELLYKTLEKRLPVCDMPITDFTVSQINECNDLVYIQLSGSSDNYKIIKLFAESDMFYEVIEPFLSLFK